MTSRPWSRPSPEALAAIANDLEASGAVSQHEAHMIRDAARVWAAAKIASECKPPRKDFFYDEEGVDGWIWEHPSGAEYGEIGLHEDPPPLHPEITEALRDAEAR